MTDGWNLGRDEIGDMLAPAPKPKPKPVDTGGLLTGEGYHPSTQDWRDVYKEDPMDRGAFWDGNTLSNYLNPSIAPHNALLVLQDRNAITALTQQMWDLANTSGTDWQLMPDGTAQFFEYREENRNWKAGDTIKFSKYRDDLMRQFSDTDAGGGNLLAAQAHAGGGFINATAEIAAFLNNIAPQDSVMVRGQFLPELTAEYNTLWRQKRNFETEVPAIENWAGKMGINLRLYQEAMGLDANSTEGEIGWAMHQLSMQGFPAGGPAGGSRDGGTGGRAVQTFLEKEGLKTAEVQRQLADFLARSRALYELQDAEQAYAIRAQEMRDRAAQPWNVSFGHGVDFNPYRGSQRLSDIIKKTIPEEVSPDYRLNEAVGLPGEGGFATPWASGMGSAAGYSNGTKLEAYAGGTTDVLADREAMLGVGTSVEKQAFRYRPGAVMAGFDANGNPVNRGVMQG
jgi:hypothetical protein